MLYENRGLLENLTDFYNIVFESAMCGSCQAHCIYDTWDLRKYLARARAGAFQNNVLPENMRRRLDSFKKYGNPYGERTIIDKGTGAESYFISCSAFNDENIVKSMESIVSRSGTGFNIFGGADLCCGAPLYYAGDMDGFKNAAQKMKSELHYRKLEKVVADCPTCIKVMTQLYPEVDINLDVEIIHTTRYLAGLLEGDTIKLRQTAQMATYYDPCILVYDLGVIEPPRTVLEGLGYRIAEPVYSKTYMHCCGARPGAKIGSSRLNVAVQRMRVDELRHTGADVYVSSCPSCKAVLSELKVKDITEVAAEHLVDE
jgi:Fe-S oxidoreductase